MIRLNLKGVERTEFESFAGKVGGFDVITELQTHAELEMVTNDLFAIDEREKINKNGGSRMQMTICIFPKVWARLAALALAHNSRLLLILLGIDKTDFTNNMPLVLRPCRKTNAPIAKFMGGNNLVSLSNLKENTEVTVSILSKDKLTVLDEKVVIADALGKAELVMSIPSLYKDTVAHLKTVQEVYIDSELEKTIHNNTERILMVL